MKGYSLYQKLFFLIFGMIACICGNIAFASETEVKTIVVATPSDISTLKPTIQRAIRILKHRRVEKITLQSCKYYAYIPKDSSANPYNLLYQDCLGHKLFYQLPLNTFSHGASFSLQQIVGMVPNSTCQSTCDCSHYTYCAGGGIPCDVTRDAWECTKCNPKTNCTICPHNQYECKNP